MKLAPWVLSIGGVAVVGTILAAALPTRHGPAVGQAPVAPAKVSQAGVAASPVSARPSAAPTTAKPAATVAAPATSAPASTASASAASTPAAAAPAAETAIGRSKAELDQLVAPVALYPDALLAQVLMASTYPADVVAAARWAAVPAHRGLKGDALAAALRAQPWDPSVMALVPFPSVLDALNAQLDWTRRLGAAFVAQRADVLDAVQRLRQSAMAAGTLKSGAQCQCQVRVSAGVVTVTPAKASVVYVPVYNPVQAFGTWASPAYPPVTLPPPSGYAFVGGVPMGYGVGIEVEEYGPLWGWNRVDWAGHAIVVDLARYRLIPGAHMTFAGGVWVHDPAHRVALRVAAAPAPAHARAAAARHRAPAKRAVAAVHVERHHRVAAAHRHAPPPRWQTARPFPPAYPPNYPPGPYAPWPPHVAMGGPYGYFGPR